MNIPKHMPDLSGRRLAALIDPSVNDETRRWIESLADETLIRAAMVAAPNRDAHLQDFCNQLITGHVDGVVFLTAAGVSHFFQRCRQLMAAARLTAALQDIQTVAVGTVVSQQLRKKGVQPTHRIDDDTGWRDLLIWLEREFPLDDMTIGLEKSADAASLTAGLEVRGCRVTLIHVIRFQQPDPSASEQDVLDAIEDGELGGLLIPNSVCAARFAHLILRRHHPALQKQTETLVVVVLDPETQQWLADCGLRSYLWQRD